MTSLAKTQPAALDRYGGYSREQIDLVKRTVANDCTDDELALFLTVSANKGLDPFSGEIFAIKRNVQTRNGWESRMTIQTGIDGFRKVAERTGQRDGMDPPQWCGPDGKWVDVWLSQDPPRAARVSVYRKGHSRPYTATALWDFYVQTKGGKPTYMWAKGGPHMLAKCAEALALREAFPSELGDIYAQEEMAQVQSSHSPGQLVAAPEAEQTSEARALVQSMPDGEDLLAWVQDNGGAIRDLDQSDQAAVWNAAKERRGKDATGKVRPTVAELRDAWTAATTEAVDGEVVIPFDQLDDVEGDTGKAKLSDWIGEWLPSIDALEGDAHDTAMAIVWGAAERLGVDPERFDQYLQKVRNRGSL